MSRPFWSARYVSTRAQLPEKLERGRAYFIGDEQIILIDYGNGAIEYGNRPGPQGAPGEPVPYLNGQIELLTEASVDNTVQIFDVHRKLNDAQANLDEKILDLNLLFNDRTESLNTKIDRENETVQKIISGIRDGLMTQINYNSEAILELISFLNVKFEKIDNVFSIVVKLLASLYPNADDDMYPEKPVNINTLEKDEILSCDSGLYRVKNSYTDTDGGMVVILETISDADQAKILTLKDGDEIITENHEVWTVSNYDIKNEQGVITLSYAGTQRLIETLKAGDVVEYDSGSFVVGTVKAEGDSVKITLTLNQ